MSTHRTRHRRQPAPAPTPEPDTTELELAEIIALWPRLEAALARDGNGPGANPSSGGGGAKAGSPAVIDLDTERIRTLIAVGVHEIEAEAIRLLNITPADRVMARIRAEAEAQNQRRATARAVLRRIARFDRPLTVDEHINAVVASAAIDTAERELAILRRRLDRVRYRSSTIGVLEQMSLWYARLRDKKQPLAQNIARDVRRWHRDTRSALRLRTREVPLGWACPEHRDDPAELVRDRDEAIVDPNVLAGYRPAAGAAPLRWKYAESVHCPACGKKWTGVEQLRLLMLMIERIELEEHMNEQLSKALDDEHLKTRLTQCGECGGVSSTDAWNAAWWAERERRMAGVGIEAELLAEYQAEGTASSYGLDDRMVCPRCGYVHADDDGPGVLEVDGVALALP